MKRATFSNGWMNWAPPQLLQAEIRTDPSDQAVTRAVHLEAGEQVAGTQVTSKDVDS